MKIGDCVYFPNKNDALDYGRIEDIQQCICGGHNIVIIKNIDGLNVINENDIAYKSHEEMLMCNRMFINEQLKEIKELFRHIVKIDIKTTLQYSIEEIEKRVGK